MNEALKEKARSRGILVADRAAKLVEHLADIELDAADGLVECLVDLALYVGELDQRLAEMEINLRQ